MGSNGVPNKWINLDRERKSQKEKDPEYANV